MRRSALRQKTCRNREKRLTGRFFRKGYFQLLLLFFLFGTPSAFSQKRVTKTLLKPGISAINIDCELCYRVVLETADTREITVEARMDGEYGKQLLVGFQEDGNTLSLETRFSPEFRFPNDKLGAHKVVSVSMKVTLPRDQQILLTSRTCEVSTSGRYRDLRIVLNDGFCELSHTAEHTEVRTGAASIFAHLDSGVVEAESRYGKVLMEPIPKGDHHLKLYSTRGDISVNFEP